MIIKTLSPNTVDYLKTLAQDEDGVQEAVELEEYRDCCGLDEIADMGALAGQVMLARRILDDLGVKWEAQ